MEEKSKIKIINKELEIENNILIENLKNKEKKMDNLKKENELLEQKNEDLKAEKEFIIKENQDLRDELDKIVYSRSYKMIQKAKKIIRRG